MSRTNEILVARGQLAELTRTSALERRSRDRQRPATYLGRVGRSHRVRLPDGKVKSVSQRHVITRGALVVNAPVTLTDGLLDTLDGTYVQSR